MIVNESRGPRAAAKRLKQVRDILPFNQLPLVDETVSRSRVRFGSRALREGAVEPGHGDAVEVLVDPFAIDAHRQYGFG
jgi:hypothetical protein